jgi:hypothetical protein
MRRVGLVVCLAALLAGCAGKVPPEWQSRVHAALDAHVAAALAGRDKVAVQELTLARREVGRTGDAGQMARVELTACAVKFASLGDGDCPAFLPLARDAGPAANAYAAYLAGREIDETGVDRLPATQAKVLRVSDPVPALAGIEDPFSRLVAAVRLFRTGRLPPAGIALAIDTASAQGWARPLLAWLGVDRDRRAAAGDVEGAAERQRAMDRILAR